MAKDESTLGFNTGYVEQIYRQYLDNPESVSESWREFFEDFSPSDSFAAATEARMTREAAAESAVATPEAPRGGDGAIVEAEKPAPPEIEGEAKPIRGPAAMIAENMEASLDVPTATSVRSFAVKMMAENRRLVNDYQRSVGGEKVSYTHLIAWAVVKGLGNQPNMNTTFREVDGQPEHVIPSAINLGLAIDIERRGRRTLLVPNIKDAGSMNFPQFVGVYNDLVRRARDNELELSDFKGTTATITNPGMIGTVLSVPRLMQGQGVIVGVGAIGFPPEYYAFEPGIVSKSGISEVMSITSTYDHRVIQGAESGAFLAHVAELLLGHHGFYKELFAELGIPYQPFSFRKDNTPQLGAGSEESQLDMIRKQARVLQLIRAHRVRGHLQADINPLGYEWVEHPELDPAVYGLTVWDLDREFVTGGLGGKEILPLREILSLLRDTYTRKIGVEYMHISDPGEKRWLEARIEPVRGQETLTPGMKRRVLSRLNAAEAFERFLHTKYIGHKRFSLEGAEAVIPMLDTILSDAADQEVHEIIIGMAHRGRLNVLANILHKPYEAIFSEFEGSIDPNTTQGSGDVKYHLGAKGEHRSENGAVVKLTLASNPSHLEAVNPVVEGMVRAHQYKLRHASDVPGGDYKDAVIPLLIHGDAAFAGQGVVAETLNLSQLPGYNTGGTIHIVINNQIGFTTKPSDARSSTYATDIARMIQAPIVHVNGDDPEACVRVARLALDFRQVFNRDVVIDMLCYRVHGHNEADEPTYTQPQLYEKIEAKRSVRKLYTEYLLRRGEMTPEEAEQMLEDYRTRLQDAFESTKELTERDASASEQIAAKQEPSKDFSDVDTAVGKEQLDQIVSALTSFPDDLNVHKKLVRQFEKRSKAYFDDGKVDWSLGELLAYGSLILDGTTVRLSGQDSRRGTFSHRHSVIVDQEDGSEYVPLNNIMDGQAHLLIYDSLLSEYAVCGFEYGYSVADPDALVIWEAQFGDFANGAQIVFDQFLSAAEKKWGQRSSLVLLLPHGYEGQGPEHSSARLERFLHLCAEGNMFVCNFTTPANLFHAMRRQVKLDQRKPMVVMSPKSLLRHPAVVSTPQELVDGRFQPVIPAEVDDPDRVKR
ncbi:MAG: multifunctional oxoglutarate decarboxylase/oxoglutarate dehydrogenase thiamine pyrophosphate-binding subunit/dihydrolipoyllysine-residue succinyltransferase subunit, partial [Rhodothermia bacterium]|nr:multifunctional oxoglutarate decarboxylase/oxoglutarate dehydrogenase thiamine pyrophosphate-binding subunit/dihydrolipoyllysine-residue succinyltransferase subunit [Rhodothermia bacterium]